MSIGPIHLTVESFLLAGFLLCGGLLIVFRDWWVTLSALLGDYFFLCVLLSRFPFVPANLAVGPLRVSALVLVQAVTGITVVGILAITVLSRRFGRQTESEGGLDEVTAARLRWAARRVAQKGGKERFRLASYLLPLSAFAALIMATLTLATLYPLARTPTWADDPSLWLYVDLAWYWLGLSGLVIVLLAQELQEISVGLLLCISSVTLLDVALSRSVGLLAIGLLNTVSIVLALGSAYLAQVFHLRLHRWQLPSAEEWD